MVVLWFQETEIRFKDTINTIMVLLKGIEVLLQIEKPLINVTKTLEKITQFWGKVAKTVAKLKDVEICKLKLS